VQQSGGGGLRDLMFSLMLRDKYSEKEAKTWAAKVIGRLRKPTQSQSKVS
jgi:hypothetical protein